MSGDQAPGRLRGGFGTKVHIAVDALDNPVRLILTGGQAADVTQDKALVAGIGAEHMIADKGYDSDDLVGAIEAGGAEAVIPPRSNRERKRDYDRHLYKERNLIERFHQPGQSVPQDRDPLREDRPRLPGVLAVGLDMVLLA